MYEHDVRDVKLFGTVAVLTGSLLMTFTFLAAGLVLATGGSTNQGAIVRGCVAGGTALVMSAALIGTGGEMRRLKPSSSLSRQNLRLDWTALLIVMVAAFGIGLWVARVLAILASLIIIGLFWTRGAVANLTNQ